MKLPHNKPVIKIIYSLLISFLIFISYEKQSICTEQANAFLTKIIHSSLILILILTDYEKQSILRISSQCFQNKNHS